MQLNEYLLIIKPSNDVYEKILSIKEAFAQNYNCPQALQSKPYITLLKFKQYTSNEKTIVEKIEKIIQQQAPFLVTVHGFDSFPTHTIFTVVETKNKIIEVVQSLKPIQSFFKIDKDNKPHFITTPHISIAKKLLPWQYEKAWIEFKHIHFKASFMVNDIVLLKRNNEKKYYATVGIYKLLNKKETTVQQVSLF